TPEPAPGSRRAETPKRPSSALRVAGLARKYVREDLRPACRMRGFRARANSICEFCLGKSQTCPGRDAPPRARPRHLPFVRGGSATGHDLRATTRQHTYLIVPIASGDDFNPLLLVRFLFGARLSRKLQHGRALARNEARQQYD